VNRAAFIETVRRHVMGVNYIALVLAMCLVAFVAASLGTGPGAIYSLMGLAALVLGAQLIGPEFSSGTLQLILSKPVNRSGYLIARFAGVVVAVWIALWVPLFVFAGMAARRPAAPGAWASFFGGAANVSLHLLLVCALLALFGAMTRSYFNVAIWFLLSTMLNVTIGIGTFMTQRGGSSWLSGFLTDHPGFLRGVKVVEENLFGDAPPQGFDRDFALMVLSNAAVALVLACIIFRRREVPYGAD
jgi:ABC-type transport system involved in multi-copper enzyme maturation permease subunit